MAKTADAAPPALSIEDCWPADGPRWSNISHEHRVQADGANWDHIAPHGGTFNEPPQSPTRAEKAAMERRVALRTSHHDTDINTLHDTIGQVEEAEETFRGLELSGEQLAQSISGVVAEAKEKRQVLLAQRVLDLNRVLSRETEIIGVLLSGSSGWLMTRLEGFFAPTETAGETRDNGLWRPIPGILVSGANGITGQIPANHDTIGLYLKEPDGRR